MSPRAKYRGNALKQKATEAKRLKVKLETRKGELDRNKNWKRLEAARKIKQVAAEAKAARKFVEDFKGGEFDDKERKATVGAIAELVQKINDWGKHPEGPDAVSAAALALAVLVARLAKFTKKLDDAAKKA